MDKLNDMRGRGAGRSGDQYQSHYQGHYQGHYQDQYQDQYQERRNYGSNPPAPHGKPFGLFDAINTIRDLRSPQNGASRQNGASHGGPAFGVPADRGLDRSAGGREGSTNPIAKLLKKVCKPEQSRGYDLKLTNLLL